MLKRIPAILSPELMHVLMKMGHGDELVLADGNFLLAAILILLSAVFHAGWNLLSKRRDPSLAFFFVASLAATVITLPVVYAFRGALTQFPPTVWTLIVFTGMAQAVYFLGLAGAYRAGDISFAY